ncbi:MAG: hypothetical protein HOV68_17465, partial [Streptomycetaceae bacterium]|nr:hypothetical protein [Streptomycetaceae bacterium]
GSWARDPDDPEDLLDRGLARFAEASAALDAADASGTEAPDLDRAHERLQTDLQLAQALWQHDRDDAALTVADRLGARLEIRLPNHQQEYAEIVTLAAQIESLVQDMPALARSRLDAALLVCRMTGATTAVELLTEQRDHLPG